MTQFIELADTGSKSFEDAMAIYVEAIPVAERQNIDTIKDRIKNGKEKLYIGSVDG
jgi:hypothetical protein